MDDRNPTGAPTSAPPTPPHAADPGPLLPRVPQPRPPSEPRLDELSDWWVRKYRALAAVRPNLAGLVLGAEVELELAGAA